MAFALLELSLVGLLFFAGLALGVASYLTLTLARKSGIETYMLRPVVVAGFVFAFSEAFLVAATSANVPFGLPVHFLLETLAIALVIYGVVVYYRMLKQTTSKHG